MTEAFLVGVADQKLVTLRKFGHSDLGQQVAWAEAIDSEQYMSRIYPNLFDGTTTDDLNYRWFVIVYKGMDVGSVWIEKENPEDAVARLGILIGRDDLLGKGIGRKAISEILRASNFPVPYTTVRLNVRSSNLRARACYDACGFHEISRGTKTNSMGQSISFLTMEKACMK